MWAVASAKVLFAKCSISTNSQRFSPTKVSVIWLPFLTHLSLLALVLCLGSRAQPLWHSLRQNQPHYHLLKYCGSRESEHVCVRCVYVFE